MTIETQSPELEARLKRGIQRFHGVDELLTKALDALEKVEPTADETTHENPLGEYKRPPGKKSLAQLFAESPLKGLDLDFSRNRSTLRAADFE